jgi:predicted small lipoprotein YifL
MKNFYKFFGIIALAALIGFSMAACGDEGGPAGGGGGG